MTLDLFGTWRLGDLAWLSLAGGVVLLPLLVWLGSVLRERRLRRFADPSQLDRLAGRRRRWPTVARGVVSTLACLLLAVTLARPQSDPKDIESQQNGRDVIFLLDVSRSMLATDVAPDRLDRAKLWINDLVSELQGDRFALVAFAGSASVRAPLTNDRSFFRLALDELTPDTVARGGTNIGDAIRKTLEMVIPNTDDPDARGHQDIILITDGEDQDSLPIEAARAAAQRGVRIIALGIGSKEGVALDADGSVSRPVRTRLESSTLAEIAKATPGGAYIEVGTGTVDLAQLYRDLIASADQAALARVTARQYTERFPWFLWPAVVLLFLDRALIPASNRRLAW